MNILIQSYNTYRQNLAGGVQTRVANFYSSIKQIDPDVHLFNKWEDKVEQYDIIHFFKLSLDHYNLMMYAKDKNIPMVLSSIVPIAEYLKIRVHLSICRYLPLHTIFDLNKKMLDLVDLIIAQTEKEKKFIVQAYQIRPAKIVVLPNGVSTNILNGDPMLLVNRLGLQKECILQVGRVDKNKNQLNVIRAMKDKNIPIVFIGGADPADVAYYEQCRSEATSNMHFLGWLAQEDPLLSSAYSMSKVVVLPSYKEIFGNALIEGAAVGANIVASQVLPISEWGLEEYCLTLNPSDVNGIASVLELAYSKDRVIGLQDMILNKFSWPSIAQEHLNVYKSIF